MLDCRSGVNLFFWRREKKGARRLRWHARAYRREAARLRRLPRWPRQRNQRSEQIVAAAIS